MGENTRKCSFFGSAGQPSQQWLWVSGDAGQDQHPKPSCRIQRPVAAGKIELSSAAGRLLSPQGFACTLPSFLQTSGNEESRLTPRLALSKPFVYLSQSFFERSTTRQHWVSKKDLHGAAERAHHSPLGQLCVSFSSRPSRHSQTLQGKQRQQHEANAGGSCAFAWEVKQPWR